jgi:hypothetical protein
MKLEAVDWSRQTRDMADAACDGGDLAAWGAGMALCTRCGQWYGFDDVHLDETRTEGGGCDRWRFAR